MTDEERKFMDEIIKKEIATKSPYAHCNFSRFRECRYSSDTIEFSNNKRITGSLINERTNRNSKQ